MQTGIATVFSTLLTHAGTTANVRKVHKRGNEFSQQHPAFCQLPRLLVSTASHRRWSFLLDSIALFHGNSPHSSYPIPFSPLLSYFSLSLSLLIFKSKQIDFFVEILFLFLSTFVHLSLFSNHRITFTLIFCSENPLPWLTPYHQYLSYKIFFEKKKSLRELTLLFSSFCILFFKIG